MTEPMAAPTLETFLDIPLASVSSANLAKEGVRKARWYGKIIEMLTKKILTSSNLVGAPRVRVDDEEERRGTVALFKEDVAKMELVIPLRVAAGLEYQGGLAVPLGNEDLEIISI